MQLCKQMCIQTVEKPNIFDYFWVSMKPKKVIIGWWGKTKVQNEHKLEGFI